jgi:hypothetical protein
MTDKYKTWKALKAVVFEPVIFQAFLNMGSKVTARYSIILELFSSLA